MAVVTFSTSATVDINDLEPGSETDAETKCTLNARLDRLVSRHSPYGYTATHDALQMATQVSVPTPATSQCSFCWPDLTVKYLVLANVVRRLSAFRHISKTKQDRLHSYRGTLTVGTSDSVVAFRSSPDAPSESVLILHKNMFSY